MGRYTADYYRKLAARMAAIQARGVDVDSERRARALSYHIACNNVASVLDNRYVPYKPGALLGMWHAAIDDGQHASHTYRLDMARVYWRAYRRVAG